MVSLQRERDRLANDYAERGEQIKRIQVKLSDAERKIDEIEFQVRPRYSFSKPPVADTPLLADR